MTAPDTLPHDGPATHPPAAGHPPRHLVLVGPMGAGKSSLGRRLAQAWALPFVDLDREIQVRANVAITTIFACEGEAGFRRRECEALAEALARPQPSVIASGGGVVLDPGNRARMREHSLVVYLRIGVDEQLARLARDRSRPLLAGEDRAAVLARLAGERGPLYVEAADLAFSPTGLGPAEAAQALADMVAPAWRPAPATAHEERP